MTIRRTALLVTFLILLRAANVSAQIKVLNFRPAAAEYSVALDRLIMVSGDPSQLHLYDAGRTTDRTVALAQPPLSLGLSPDGLHAAVGHASSISYVDLASGVVEKVFAIPVSAQSVLLSDSWIYVMPNARGGYVASIRIADAQVTIPDSAYEYVFAGRFNPAANAVYAAQTERSRSGFQRLDTSGGVILGSRQHFEGVRETCGAVFFSPAGDRAYTGCGLVFRTSTDPALDMSYVTSFDSTLRSLTESAAGRQIALIPGLPLYPGLASPDDVVLLYETEHLNRLGQFALAEFQGPAGRTYPAHGKWVFFNASSSQLYAIAQAEENSALLNDFEIQTIPLSTSTPCDVSFAASGADIIADGVTETVAISGPVSCLYGAASDSPWLEIASGGFGSGKGVLTYIVRANRNLQRVGRISVGKSVFTVTQAGRSGDGSFARLPYNVADAAYSKIRDQLFIVSAAPAELHVIDLVNQQEQAIPLVRPALSVSVAPDGKHAAVGHDGWVSEIDLQTMSVSRVVPIPADAFSVLMAGNGFVYVFSKLDILQLYSVDMAKGTTSADRNGDQASAARLGADGNFIYSNSQFGVAKWSIAGGIANFMGNAADRESACGNLWISENGKRLFTSCARVYQLSSVAAEDLEAKDRLPPLNYIRWVDTSVAHGSTAVIPYLLGLQEPGTDHVHLYGEGALNYQGSVAVPPFPVGDKTYAGDGQFVFWNRDGSKLFVIEKADTSAGLMSSYAVAALSPATPGQTPFSIPNFGGGSWKTPGIADTTQVGSGRIEGINEGSPEGLAIFGSRQNGVLISEATVPAAEPVSSGRIYAEVSSTVNTGVALANPNPAAAHLSFFFTDQAGAGSGSGTLTIPAQGQIAAFLNEPPFNGSASLTGTFTFTSDLPVGAIALRAHLNQRAEFLWTTLPVVPLTTNFYETPIFPTFDDGGGWTTQFILVNPTNYSLSGTLEFYKQGTQGPISQPGAMNVTIGGRTGSSFPYSIAPQSSVSLKTSGAGNSVGVGTARIVPDRESYYYSPAGIAILAENNSDGISISEAGVPATLATGSVVMYAEASNDPSQIRTGVAIANTGTTPAIVQVDLTTLAGTPTGLTGRLTVPAGGQVQVFMDQIPGLEHVPVPFQGMLRFSQLSPVLAVVGLRSRYNERHEFLITTTSPVQPFSRHTTGVMFPHFADGGGFTTEIILLNASGLAQTGSLKFFSPSGQLLNLIPR